MLIARALLFLAPILLLPAPGALAASANMKEGLWEMRSEVSMPGLPPGMKMPAITLRHCYTREEIESNKAVQPQDSDCKVTRMNHSGNTMHWAMECKGENAMVVEGKGTFQGNSYTLTNTMRMLSGEMKGQTMSTKITAKRVGACK